MYLENTQNMQNGIIIDNLQSSNPCEYCPNNPKNNPLSSGFCNCVLPYKYNIIY